MQMDVEMPMEMNMKMKVNMIPIMMLSDLLLNTIQQMEKQYHQLKD